MQVPMDQSKHALAMLQHFTNDTSFVPKSMRRKAVRGSLHVFDDVRGWMQAGV